MCACTARSRAAPLRESSARRSAGAAPRCPKAESTIRLPDLMTVSIEKPFPYTVRKETAERKPWHNRAFYEDAPLRACAFA
jgi:hypothetical protein